MARDRIDSKHVFMVCGNASVAKDVGEMLRRVASAMSAVLTFSDALCELDEEAPDIADQAAMPLERLTLTLMSLYPDQRQMHEDIKSIGDFKVRSV